MRKEGARVTKWLGRLLLVAVPYVILCALFAPRGVQVLNQVICQPKQHLDNHSFVQGGGAVDTGANRSIELVCRQGAYTVNVTAKLLAFVGVLIIVAFASFTLSSRLARERFLVPVDPRQHE